MKTYIKNIKTKVLVFVLVIGLPLQMCSPIDDDDCNCGVVTGKYFDINGMELKNYKKVGENSVNLMIPNEAVSYEKYAGLTVEYSVDYISQSRPKRPSFSLIPSAYACSCIGNGDYGSKFEKLSNITVITLNDFDETHKANDTINDLILAKGFYNQEDEYLQNYLINDTTNIQLPAIKLLVDRKPTLDENYKVKVIVELSTGEIYQNVSESIIIR
ncbi:hypothetical protein Aeqsu_1762 [Aequorivita sublithincola DSM 14238]|uniref:DUF5034 domain-containing protein n=1 Tax=Aequorivita sublithincola (strain DSM 14238 / LMG 21431 / ACAM 643 / 9-3) TaxID=746697 RepID=I3YW73_AEQSU|nr:hypothetical protein [Aequorivita sublithincola]AFL81241.1 hypothetical protein Aeqsu_1762 [Aequorivita sublithincola DSM 14238]